MGRLDGRVAVVTGAGGGIGKEHALLLAREGARVVVNDISYRRSADADAVVAEIVQLGGVAIASRSSATWDGAAEIVDAALEHFGRIDILVNNATAAWAGDLWAISEEQWDLTQGVNLKGYFALMRAAVPHMARQGSGVVVNTSSGSGFGDPGNSAYSAAKEGVVGLTRTAGRELGRFGIRVNAIRPIAVGRSFAAYLTAMERHHRITEYATGMRPMAGVTAADHTPDRISPLVVWLCTDAAAHVNARIFNVADGRIELLADEVVERSVVAEHGWTLDQLDAFGSLTLAEGLRNPWTIPDHPDLKVWDD